MFNLIRYLLLILAGTSYIYGGLLHRYSFEGTDSEVVDSVGGKDGSFHGGAKLKGTGYLDLDGVNDFVELPPGILGETGSVTFETWTIWKGPSSSSWQNLFHFSESDLKYLYLTPRTGTGSKHVRFGISSGGSEKRVDGLDQLKGDGRQVNYLALVYDGELGQMSFYLDGEFQKTASTTVDLKSITQQIDGLCFTHGLPITKAIHEFRIHDGALSLKTRQL